MNKLIIILSIIFLASACSLGSTDAPTTTTQEKTNTTENAGNMRESTYQKDLNQASPKIKDSEEFKSCMDASVPMCVQNAGMQLAQKSQSKEFCNELSTSEQKESCVFAVTMIQLESNNDSKVCDGLTNTYKEQCIKTAIQSQAIRNNDPKICTTLVQKTASGNTIQMQDAMHDECVMSVIMSNPSAKTESCESIKGIQVREMCIKTLEGREAMRDVIVTPSQN